MKPFSEMVREWVMENKNELLAFNRQLVAAPSVNRYPDGDEAAVQKIIYDKLLSLGCETESFLPTEVTELTSHPAYMPKRNYENRPNVVGKKRGKGQGRSILFSGHVDTVPLGKEEWVVDPFSASIVQDKQYGLGLFDMKGGMSAAIGALQCIQTLGIQLDGDVWIETVVDEEYGGANGTLACRLKGIIADIAIVPEPTNLKVCPAHQGGTMYRITYHGQAGRGFSGELTSSPVDAAGRFILFFRTFQDSYARTKPAEHFENQSGLPAYIQAVRAGDMRYELSDRSPASCEIDVWLQCYPATTQEELFETFTKAYYTFAEKDEILAGNTGSIEQLIRFLPGSQVDMRHPIFESIREATGGRLPVEGAPLACDAFMFNLYSPTPAIIWGPSGGNAHASDEYIYVDDFLELVQMYALTIIQWCGIHRN